MIKTIPLILDANADYKALIGSNSSGNAKVYINVSPQGENKPYAVCHKVSGVEDHNKEERGVYTRFVQIDQYAKTAVEASNLEDSLISSLDRYSGIVSGINIESIRVMSSNDTFSDELEIHGASTEFKIRVKP